MPRQDSTKITSEEIKDLVTVVKELLKRIPDSGALDEMARIRKQLADTEAAYYLVTKHRNELFNNETKTKLGDITKKMEQMNTKK